MKKVHKYFLPLLVMLLLAFALPGSAQASDPMRLVIGETFTLESGETLEEDLVVIGGTATLEKGSKVEGDIVLMGGSLEISGVVEGNIAATGGYIRLHETAVVEGDIAAAGADIDQEEGAQVKGEINTDFNAPFQFSAPDSGVIPRVQFAFSPFWKAASFVVRVFVLSGMAVLIAMFFPTRLQRVSQTLVSQPLISGGLGCMTLLIAPLVALLLAITLILLPASLLGILLLVLLGLVGWLALGLEVGNRLGLALKQEWTPPLAAGLGTFVLTLVVGSLSYIACIGWVFPVLVISLGLGAVLLTRLGSQTYPEPAVQQVNLTSETPPAEGPTSA